MVEFSQKSEKLVKKSGFGGDRADTNSHRRVLANRNQNSDVKNRIISIVEYTFDQISLCSRYMSSRHRVCEPIIPPWKFPPALFFFFLLLVSTIFYAAFQVRTSAGVK